MSPDAVSESSPDVFAIGPKTVGRGQPCFIVAEIGVNHEGSIERCLDLTTQAAHAGANAIKLQTAQAEDNYAPDTEAFRQYSSTFLSMEDTGRVFDLAHSLGMAAFTTTGVRTLEAIEKLGPDAYKISSGTLTHYPLLQAVSRMGRPLILSTGMSDLAETLEAVATARRAGAHELSVLQCTSLYPAPDEELHLAAIQTLARECRAVGGFSDHTDAAHAAPLAVAAGAKIIEKHFTFDQTRPGWDHHISLNEHDFRDMVAEIRRVETCLGSPAKGIGDAQAKVAASARRYAVAFRDIRAGAIISLDDLTFWRLQSTGTVIPAKQADSILGRRAAHDIARQMPIYESDLA